MAQWAEGRGLKSGNFGLIVQMPQNQPKANNYCNSRCMCYLHSKRMSETTEEDEPFLTRERFENTWKTLKSTKKDKYKFLMHGGSDLKESVFKLFQVVWQTETCPLLWDKTQIIQIFKAGNVEELTCFRNIHIKSEIGKMFGHIVVNKVKENLTNNMSPFQTARPGHRSQENIFILKSLMALNEKYDEPLILQLMDIKTFFDKELLVDVLDAAYANNVKGKEYKLLYELNKRREIKVLTAIGESTIEEVDK